MARLILTSSLASLKPTSSSERSAFCSLDAAGIVLCKSVPRGWLKIKIAAVGGLRLMSWRTERMPEIAATNQMGGYAIRESLSISG